MLKYTHIIKMAAQSRVHGSEKRRQPQSRNDLFDNRTESWILEASSDSQSSSYAKVDVQIGRKSPGSVFLNTMSQ